MAFIHSQVVYRGGGLAGINRAAHHGHRNGGDFTTTCHEGHCSQYGYRRLAYAHYMAVDVFSLQVADKLLHVVDVVVQMKFTVFERNQAGVFPVGNVYLVVFKQRLYGVA